MLKIESIVVLILIMGIFTLSMGFEGENMKVLTIQWQRLVDERGNTCDRCGSTGNNVHKAYSILQESLAPLHIKVKLEEKLLDPVTCAKDILESNRIWINDRPLEEWLNASVGMSSCDFCCDKVSNDTECRTIIMKKNTFEEIPVELLLKACLLAASELMDTEPQASCCEDKNTEQGVQGSCCQETGCCPKQQ